MKKKRSKIFTLFIVSILFSISAHSQNEPLRQLVLTSYVIPINQVGAVIGEFVTSKSEPISLIDDKQNIFEIKNNQLKLKKGKSITELSPMIYTIKVGDSQNQYEFDLVKDEFLKNKVIAHRGAWKHTGQTQNSIGALKAAIDLGVEAVEFDLWLTKDGVLAINHDNDHDGMIMEKTDFNKLLKVKLSNGETISTLEDFITVIKRQNKVKLVLEMKSNRNNQALKQVDALVKEIQRLKAQAWVDYISFDYNALKRLRAYDPTARLSLLEPFVSLDVLKLDNISGIDYHFTIFEKEDRLVERCNMLGLTTNAWTVNTKEEMINLLDQKIDFITTDEPEILLELVK